MASTTISSGSTGRGSRLPPKEPIREPNKLTKIKTQNDSAVKRPLIVADLIRMLVELPEEYKSSNLVIRTEDGANFVDKIEFTTVNNTDEKDPKTYYEIKVSSELELKAY